MEKNALKFCPYLTGGGHAHCAGPVVVEMCHLVRESLDDVHLPVAVVMDHDVVSGRDGSLTHVLTHQEEVIPGINNNDLNQTIGCSAETTQRTIWSEQSV